MAEVLEDQLQHQFFQWIFKVGFLWIDWFDLPAVQGTRKSLLQHQASVLQGSAFFMVQLSHPYMTTGKTIALTIRTFVGKEMSLLFNTLSRLVIAFLPRSKRLLISWLQPPSTVIWEPRKIVCHCFHCSPIYLPWCDGIRKGWQKGMTGDETVGWPHQLDGYEFEQALGVGDEQGSLACYSPWGRKELDTTEWLNWTELMGPDTMILVFWILSFKPAFSLSSFTFIKRLFSPSSLYAIRMVLSAYLRLLIFFLAI